MQTLADVINMNNRQRRGGDADSRFGNGGAARDSGNRGVMWGDELGIRFQPGAHARRNPQQQQYGPPPRSQNFGSYARHQRPYPRTGGATFSQPKYGRLGAGAMKPPRQQWNQHDLVMRQVLEVQRRIQEQEQQAQVLQQASGLLQKLLLQMQKPDDLHSFSETETGSTRCGSVGGRASSGSTCSRESPSTCSPHSVLALVREAASSQESAAGAFGGAFGQASASSPWTSAAHDVPPFGRDWNSPQAEAPAGLGWAQLAPPQPRSETGSALCGELLQRLQSQQREKEVLERLALLQSVEELLSARSGPSSSLPPQRSPRKEYSEQKHPDLPLDEIVRRRFHERLVKDHAYRNPSIQQRSGAPAYPSVGFKEQSLTPPGQRRPPAAAEWLDPSMLLWQDAPPLRGAGWNSARSAPTLSPKTPSSSLCSPLVFPLESPEVGSGSCDGNVGAAPLDADCRELEKLSGVEALLENWGGGTQAGGSSTTALSAGGLSSTSLNSLEENSVSSLAPSFKGPDAWLWQDTTPQPQPPSLALLPSVALSEDSLPKDQGQKDSEAALGSEEQTDKDVAASCSEAGSAAESSSGFSGVEAGDPSKCEAVVGHGHVETPERAASAKDFEV